MTDLVIVTDLLVTVTDLLVTVMDLLVIVMDLLVTVTDHRHVMKVGGVIVDPPGTTVVHHQETTAPETAGVTVPLVMIWIAVMTEDHETSEMIAEVVTVGATSREVEMGMGETAGDVEVLPEMNAALLVATMTEVPCDVMMIVAPCGVTTEVPCEEMMTEAPCDVTKIVVQ